MDNDSDYITLLKRFEGYSAVPYLDSEDYMTIGYGNLLSKTVIDPAEILLVISEPVALLMMRTKADALYIILGRTLPFFLSLNIPKQDVLVSMAYQLGIEGLMDFKRMLAALHNAEYKLARTEALDSLWAKQTPNRAAHHAYILGKQY